MDNLQDVGLAAVFRVTQLAQLIIERLDETPAALSSLRLVCKDLNALCVPRIYRFMTLHISWQELKLTYDLVKCTIARPEYFGLVREISVISEPSSHAFAAIHAVYPETKAELEASKEFRCSCSMVMALAQRTPELRKFKWEINETMPERLLEALQTHPNSPTIDLVQEFFPGDQAITTFSHIQANSTLSELVSAIARNVAQALEGNSFTFPKLRTLTIDGNRAPFSESSNSADSDIPNDHVADPFHFLEWQYPAMQTLVLTDFPGWGLFLRKLEKQTIQLSDFTFQVQCSRCNNRSVANFLSAFEGLETFKLIETEGEYDQQYNQDTSSVLDALLHHKTSLISLELDSCHDATRNNRRLRQKLPFLTKTIETIKSLPNLEHLGLQFNIYQSLGLLTQLMAPRLRTMDFYFMVPTEDDLGDDRGIGSDWIDTQEQVLNTVS